MRHDEDRIHHTELSEITLPSGLRIEIIYVDGEPFAVSDEHRQHEDATAEPVSIPAEQAAADEAMADALDDLTVCGSCGSMLVQPVSWFGLPTEVWQVELRCPECEEHATTLIEDELAEQLELFHQRARALIELEMLRMAGENAEIEIGRFARALEQELIFPEDF